MADSCDIPTMAAEGISLGFGAYDKTSSIAAKIFLMADTIKDLSNGAIDYTNICSLAESMNNYHGLPSYVSNAARIVAWGRIHEITVGQPPNWDDVRAAVSCAHCGNIGQEDLEEAFTFLLCTLVNLIKGP